MYNGLPPANTAYGPAPYMMPPEQFVPPHGMSSEHFPRLPVPQHPMMVPPHFMPPQQLPSMGSGQMGHPMMGQLPSGPQGPAPPSESQDQQQQPPQPTVSGAPSSLPFGR